MKTIQKVELELTEKAKQASLEYLQAIDKILTDTKKLKVNILPINTHVFNQHGDELGIISYTEWTISQSNTYNMPVAFSFTYFVKKSKKDVNYVPYKPQQLFTKAQILKAMESKIARIRKVK